MNKIQSLIAQHCPNGVEYKELKHVCQLRAGDRITKAIMKDDERYPVIGGGTEPTGFYSDFNFENAVTISRAGSAGFVGFQKNKFWATDVCFVAIGKEILTKFVYYYLKSKQYDLQQHLYGAPMPKLDKNYLWNLKIPLPPLPVQEEIVRILDAFTELQTELQTELELRKKQYQYYRDKLLCFENINGGGGLNVEYRTLGEVCDNILAGGDVPKKYKKGQLFPTEEFPYPIYSNGTNENSLYGYTDGYKIDKEAVTISARGTIGWHTTRKAKFTPIVRLITLIPNQKIITTKYLNYVLNVIEINSSGGSIPQLTIPMVINLKIPLPPLEEQKKIVGILDSFDKLVNDIANGIPAEIEMRKKQYEYYRDRLLSFERVC